jgi:hypothetical protein
MLRERGDVEGHHGPGTLISAKMIEHYYSAKDDKKWTGITGLGMRALHDSEKGTSEKGTKK